MILKFLYKHLQIASIFKKIFKNIYLIYLYKIKYSAETLALIE